MTKSKLLRRNATMPSAILHVCPNPRFRKSGTTRSMPITTNFNRGAVVLIPFPFSGQTSSKVRPAVIVNPGYPSDDLLVVGLIPFRYQDETNCAIFESWRDPEQ